MTCILDFHDCIFFHSMIALGRANGATRAGLVPTQPRALAMPAACLPMSTLTHMRCPRPWPFLFLAFSHTQHAARVASFRLHTACCPFLSPMLSLKAQSDVREHPLIAGSARDGL